MDVQRTTLLRACRSLDSIQGRRSAAQASASFNDRRMASASNSGNSSAPPEGPKRSAASGEGCTSTRLWEAGEHALRPRSWPAGCSRGRTCTQAVQGVERRRCCATSPTPAGVRVVWKAGDLSVIRAAGARSVTVRRFAVLLNGVAVQRCGLRVAFPCGNSPDDRHSARAGFPYSGCLPRRPAGPAGLQPPAPQPCRRSPRWRPGRAPAATRQPVGPEAGWRA